MKFLQILFFSVASACVDDYQQCGGLDYTGDSECCSPGALCVEINPYWFQCVPPVEPPPQPQETVPPVDAPPEPTVAPTPEPTPVACDTTRRSITDSANPHVQTFIDGVKQLKATGEYDELTKQHGNATTFFRFHKNAMFLPWHRWYVWQLEQKIRNITGCFAMPYWDWSADAADPMASPLWNIVGEANTNGSCLTTGPFVDFKGAYDGDCIRRNTNPENAKLFTREELMELIHANQTFIEWSHHFEDTAHARPHLLVAKQMSSMPAPDDPLFYLHHAFTDLVFSAFLACHGTELHLDEVIIPFSQNVTIAEALSLTIDYDDKNWGECPRRRRT